MLSSFSKTDEYGSDNDNSDDEFATTPMINFQFSWNLKLQTVFCTQQPSHTKTKIRQQICKHVKENELEKKIHIFDMGAMPPYQIYNGKIR